MQSEFTIPTITVDEHNASVFGSECYPASWRSNLLLSEQVPALNFRWRASAAAYSSQWHVAGDPTLIIVLTGVLRIILRDGTYRDFGAGERFIAKDFLPSACDFDNLRHGHRAEVLGDAPLEAIHIKLSVLNQE